MQIEKLTTPRDSPVPGGIVRLDMQKKFSSMHKHSVLDLASPVKACLAMTPTQKSLQLPCGVPAGYGQAGGCFPRRARRTSATGGDGECSISRRQGP